jgi:hypothetical protein
MHPPHRRSTDATAELVACAERHHEHLRQAVVGVAEA